jgi:hypothetical protein
MYNQGLSFPELADVLIEFGVVEGGNHDGGSSTTVINTAISPIQLFPSSDGGQAPVINHIMIFANKPGGEIPVPPIGEKVMYKGNAKTAPVNVKPMDGSSVLAQLQVGWWVYGDYSTTKSDLINVTAYYKGTETARVDLIKPCKVTAAALNITEVIVIPPPVDPPVVPPKIITRILDVDTNNGKVRVDGGVWL